MVNLTAMTYDGRKSSRRTSASDRNFWQFHDYQLDPSSLTVTAATNYQYTESGIGSPPTRTLPSGNITFKHDFFDTEVKPYIRANHNEDPNDVVNVLACQWRLPCPSIVVVVISSMQQTIRDDLTHWKSLQDGLVKAANTTPMWIVTNGVNSNVAKLVGEAVLHEEQHRQAQICSLHPERTVNLLPQLNLIGITSEDVLVYPDNLLDGKGTKLELPSEGNRPQENKFELNPDHTHYIVVKDETFDHSGAQTFTVNLADYLMHNAVSDNVGDPANLIHHRTEIPVVGLLICGGNDCVRLALELVKHEIPVVVLKNSGGAADLLTYAYDEIKEKNRGEWDPEYVEVFVKSELSRKIAMDFPLFRENNLARNRFRDRILECVRFAEQKEKKFLSFLDVYSQTCNLNSMEQEILKALFKSQSRGKFEESQHYEQLQKDLYLTLDWNSPEIALCEVFQKDPTAKFKVDKNVFEEALFRQNREAFIDLFLEQGFQIHKFLTERRLRRLFEKAEGPQFFRAVCWEEILGHRLEAKLGRDFIKKELNWLVHKLTGMRDFIPVQELTSNAMGFYTTDPVVAERKSLNALIIWAALMNRHQLVNVLWKRSDQPIHVALLVSLLFDNLARHVRDQGYLFKELEDTSREFEMMAVGVLDLSFQQNNCRANDALNEKMSEWNYQTAVELAAYAKHESFICHPCCQKWLNDRFMGNFRIKELKFGPFTIPTSIKVILAAFLVIPIYWWIQFQTSKQVSVTGTDDESDMEDDIREMNVAQLASVYKQPDKTSPTYEEKDFHTDVTSTKMFKGMLGPTASWIMKPKAWHRRPKWTKEKPRLWYIRHGPQPPLFKKIYLLWSAPITKFWTFQITYIMYLAFFSYVVLLPSCGNYILDPILWCWTFLILLEITRRAYVQATHFSSMPILSKCIEIFLVALFLLLYLVLRIVKLEPIQDLFPRPTAVTMPYAARVVLCLGLLYFYFRLMVIYFPISPTLGPLLYRMRLMIIIDFVNFMRMAILIIISSGIVIHAVMYPDYPMSNELMRRAFHKSWFSMYLTFISDLEVDPHCPMTPVDYGEHGWQNETCWMGNSTDASCATTGFWPYMMNVQYLVNMKLILLTLLYAMFSTTQMDRAADSDAIWKFQRYRLVFDFDTRLRLPPPLNLFSYVAIGFELLWKCCCCACCKHTDPETKDPERLQKQRLKANDFTYWRSMASEYYRLEQEAQKKKNLEKEQLERLNSICYSSEYQISVLKHLKSSMSELEKVLQSSRIALEEIKHEFIKSDEKMVSTHANLLSRQSPYPGTKVQRFQIADKYVPWEVLFSTYDPVVYSKPRLDYPPAMRDFVDEDVLFDHTDIQLTWTNTRSPDLRKGKGTGKAARLREKQGERFKLPEMKWNIVYTSGAGVSIDRTSWMVKDDGEPIIYKLDSTGLPVNAVGRTGLRGRGSLPHWGPNHAIFLTITKWRSQGFLHTVVPELKTLEFIVGQNETLQWVLPGGLVLHHETIYDVIKAKFNVNTEGAWSLDDMKQFFHDFAAPRDAESNETVDPEEPYPNIICTLTQRGYFDDGLNTDNAWIEAEIWHIHFKSSCNLDGKNLRRMQWRTNTSQIRNKMPLSHVTILDKIIHKLEGSTMSQL